MTSNNNNGWICLHRQIMEHWIWTDPVKLKWWMDVLLSVNHEDTKVNVGMQIYDCKAGQSIRSLGSWAKSFGCSKDTVRNFFRLLESDKMIRRETIGKSTRSTTRLTVCNYGRYQGRPYSTPTSIRTQAVQDTNTNNNDNNDNKNKNKNSASEFEVFCQWMKEEAPHLAGWKQMTEMQYNQLRKKYSQNDIVSVVMLLENNSEIWNKYINVYPTVRKWLKGKK